MSRSESQPTDFRWLAVVGLVAGLSHGAYCFLSVDASDMAMLAPPATTTPTRSSSDPFYNSRSPDEREYLDLAESLAERGELRLPTGDVAKRMPLYPAFLALFRVTQPPAYWRNGAILVQTLLAWCNSMMIALIAARLAGPLAGVIAGVVAGLYAPYIYLETLFLTETLLNTCVLGATCVYLSWRADPAGIRSLIGVSLLMGTAALCRANAILILAPFVVDVIGYGAMKKKASRSLRLAAVLMPAMLMLAPWAWRNHHLLGRATLSTIGGLNLYLGHNPDYALHPGLDQADYGRFDRLREHEGEGLSEIEADRRLSGEAVRFIRDHAGLTLVNCATKVRVWFTPTIASFGPVMLVWLSGVCCIVAWQPAGRPGRSASNTIGAMAPPPRMGLWRAVASAAFLTSTAAYVGHVLSDTSRTWPLIAPGHVLLIGIPALLMMRSALPGRSLLLGLVGSQLLVAIVYIPLARIRWSVDAAFIIAIGVAASQVCRAMKVKRPVMPARV